MHLEAFQKVHWLNCSGFTEAIPSERLETEVEERDSLPQPKG